jgi:serine protease AprX
MRLRLTARREGRVRRPTRVAVPALVVLALAVMAAAGAASSGATAWRAKIDPALFARAAAGETEFFVELARQADLSGAYALRTKEAKGRFVYDRLTATARVTQAPLRSQLAQLGVRHRAYWIVNAIWVRGDLHALEATASRPEVARVFPNARGRFVRPLPAGRTGDSATRPKRTAAPEPGLVQVGAPQVWALGYTGQGAVVASADTGVSFDHPALLGKYRGWDGATVNHDYNWHDGIAAGGGVCPAPSQVPCDDFGHGSHTAGTMVGDDGAGNQIGMAPGAKWIACRNMDRGNGTVETYLNCMQWLMAPTKIDGTGADTTKAPHVVNNSWSCTPSEGCNVPQPLLRSQVDASRAAGIVYVSSAGNSGPACGSVNTPLGIYENAFTVGAVVTGADTIANFSSRGPANDNGEINRKPNISAPGNPVRSSTPAPTLYSSFSGTSMSAPHVAGLVALLISAKPSLAGKVNMIENIIEQSAVPIPTGTAIPTCGGDSTTKVPNNVYGWGRIDAYAAVQLALGPTEVTVSSFAATRTRSGVNLRWRTASASRGLGFDVWRSSSLKGRFVKLTSALIPARPVPASATYRFLDRSARTRRHYVYRLESVDLSGARRIVGLVRVR